MVNKASMIEKIAELVRDGRIDGISDVRDESDRRGMRVVVELKKDADDQVVLNQLFKLTPMQTTFGVNMVALVRNRPQTLGLVALLQHFLDFRREVVRRRAAYDLRQAEARAHILEGFAIALDNLDAVIALIRAQPEPGRGARRPRCRSSSSASARRRRSSSCACSASPRWSARRSSTSWPRSAPRSRS